RRGGRSRRGRYAWRCQTLRVYHFALFSCHSKTMRSRDKARDKPQFGTERDSDMAKAARKVNGKDRTSKQVSHSQPRPSKAQLSHSRPPRGDYAKPVTVSRPSVTMTKPAKGNDAAMTKKARKRTPKLQPQHTAPMVQPEPPVVVPEFTHPQQAGRLEQRATRW